jgi:hypothetical protein
MARPRSASGAAHEHLKWVPDVITAGSVMVPAIGAVQPFGSVRHLRRDVVADGRVAADAQRRRLLDVPRWRLDDERV